MKPAVLDTTTPRDWLESAVECIEQLALTRSTVSAEDLRPLITPPHHVNAFGAAFRTAAGRGIIAYKEHRRSATPSRNRSPVSVWVAGPNLRKVAS